MKKTALTASAITLLASGVGLGNEGSATASASVSATASVSASGVYCHQTGGVCEWETATHIEATYQGDGVYRMSKYQNCRWYSACTERNEVKSWTTTDPTAPEPP